MTALGSRTIGFVLLLVVLCSLPSFSGDATFPRHPAVSPTGETIAFSYAGDIWTIPSEGGDASRLTTHQAYEHTPRWSPDGQWIAFSADREGRDDIYVIPSTGGTARRLTFMSVDDFTCDWTPDGKSIIFSSKRDDIYPDYWTLYIIPFEGGTPAPLMDTYGFGTSVSPVLSAEKSDKNWKILYTRRDVQWWRKHYRGSGAGQVWIYDNVAGTHTAVTDTVSPNSGEGYRYSSSRWALWGANGEIYLTTDRDGTFNLWKRAKHSWKQLTTYESDGIRFPSISRNGRVIAYEYGLDLYVMENGGAARKLKINAPFDNADFEPEVVSFSDKAERLSFTPDSRQFIIEVRGEVFAGRVTDKENKAARLRAHAVSGDNPARDGDFTLSPGGDSLVFISDRNGSKDLYLVYSDDPDTRELASAFRYKTERLTDHPAEDHFPRWSPDGNSIAFVRGKGDLYIYDLKKKVERLLISGWSLSHYSWSPDGKWLSYARNDDEYNSDVFIIPSDGGSSVNVSRHPDDDEFPVWSDDGSKLAFRSRRRENNWDIYYVFLRLADHQKSKADWAEEKWSRSSKSDDDSDNKNDGKKKDKKDKGESAVEVVIDTTDIYRRLRPVTNLAGEEGFFAMSPDGEKFAFMSDHEKENDLYIIDRHGEDLKRLTTGGVNPRYISFDKDGKRVRYLDGKGKVKSVAAKGGSSKSHEFNARITVDPMAERSQKFGEIWRTLNDIFYDPDFHGIDWAAMKTRYEPLIEAASCEEDFGDLMKMMFGELNASHMNYYTPESSNNHTTGRLGLDFDFSDDGPGLLISYVLPRGPCDKDNNGISDGERLLAINGTHLEKGVNLHKLLDEQEDQRVALTVVSGKKERRVFVRPMGSWWHGYLRYEEWVSERRREVDRLSQGKLGYLHIRGMGDMSLSRFEAQLYSLATGKDGLVIDVRFNSGGWITDQLLAILRVDRHAVTFPRDGGPGYPQGRLPLYSWVKPIVVLCNEHSFSNAEIFSHSIKTLKRGKLVGVPTPGGVISTGDQLLLDGSSFRTPLRGWYTGTERKRDAARDMDGNGAVPDFIVPLHPNLNAPEEDLQLQKAIEVLLSEIRDKSQVESRK